MRIPILLLAACGNAVSPPPTTTEPIANAPLAAPAAAVPTCVRAESGFSQARIVDGAVLACYFMPQQGADGDDCWRFDLATRAWRFATRQPHAEVATLRSQVKATATKASVCKRDGSDCKTVQLSGITVGPDDTLEGATNADRSIVAVWTHSGPVHAFDAAGKRLATIKPWAAGMNGKDPSFFRAAHVLGNVLEVRIADTPISAAIRLYDARTGTKIADVFGGQPMDDEVEPVALGGTDYVFVTVDTRSILVVDVATGKQRARYPLGDVTLSEALIARVGAGLAGVIATTAFVVDGRARVSTVVVPACPQ